MLDEEALCFGAVEVVVELVVDQVDGEEGEEDGENTAAGRGDFVGFASFGWRGGDMLACWFPSRRS